MFLLGEDVLKNMKFAIKGTEITEEISNAEIERFNGLADGIYRSVCDKNTKIKRTFKVHFSSGLVWTGSPRIKNSTNLTTF